jgi:hypothetical protein
MKKIFWISLIIFCTISLTYGQKWRHTWTEIIIGGGATKVYGDIGGSKFGYAFQGGVRFKIYQYSTIKVSVTYGKGSGSDAGTKNNDRGYSYETILIEPSLRFEYHFFTRQNERIGTNFRELIIDEPKINTYIFAGAGGLYFKPTPGDELEQVYKNDFSKFTITIPVGIGFKYGLSRTLSADIELGGHFPSSDYLDGYASPSSKVRDFYFFGLISISWKLNIHSDTSLF